MPRSTRWPALLVVCLLLTGLAPVGAAAGDAAMDPALAQAMELERKGEARQAADAYRAWIEAHPNPKDAATGQSYAEVLVHLGRVEPDARLYQHLLEAAPLDALPQAARLDLLVLRAELLDGLGEVEPAQAAYALAAAQAPDPEAAGRYRLRAASLLSELGRVGEAVALAGDVIEDARARSDGTLAASALYLVGRAHAATARPDDAIRAWSAVLQSYPFSASAPSACYGIYTVTLGLGRVAEAEDALSLLTRFYPDSPELAMATASGKGRAVPAPRPTALLEPYLAAVYQAPPEAVQAPEPVPAQAPETAQGPTEPETQPAADDLVVVLTGSYTNRENAERNSAQLSNRGFAARIVEVEVKGSRYYRVLVGEPTSRDLALVLAQRLKDRDVESSLLAVGARTGG